MHSLFDDRYRGGGSGRSRSSGGVGPAGKSGAVGASRGHRLALGVSHVDAASVRVTLRLGSRTNAAIYNAQVLAPVVDAMVQSGVDRASIEMPPNFQAPGNAVFATISGTAKNPTVESMQRAVSTVGAAISAIPGAILQETQN